MKIFLGLTTLLMAITPITNTSNNSLTVRLNEPMKMGSSGVIRLQSSTPILSIESASDDVDMSCNVLNQNAVCDVFVAADVTGEFLKIKYEPRADNELVMDFLSSDEPFRFGTGVLATNDDGIFVTGYPSNSGDDEYDLTITEGLDDVEDYNAIDEPVVGVMETPSSTKQVTGIGLMILAGLVIVIAILASSFKKKKGNKKE